MSIFDSKNREYQYENRLREQEHRENERILRNKKEIEERIKEWVDGAPEVFDKRILLKAKSLLKKRIAEANRKGYYVEVVNLTVEYTNWDSHLYKNENGYRYRVTVKRLKDKDDSLVIEDRLFLTTETNPMDKTNAIINSINRCIDLLNSVI